MDQQTLQKILDASLDMYLILDKNGTLLEFKPSPNFDPLLPPSEFLGRSIEEVLPADLAETSISKAQAVLSTGEEDSLEYSLPCNGSLCNYEARFSSIDTESVLVIIRDVTDKVRIRKALEESEEQYRRLFEYNPMPMFVSDTKTWDILNVNQAAVNHYGYEKGELLSMNLKDIRPPEDVGLMAKRIGAANTPVDSMGVFRHLKKDGTTVLMDVYSHEVDYEGRKARLALCHDVTDQMRAREALEESEERLRNSLGEKEILLKEIHHRVKNNLQVVSGLLDLQATHTQDLSERQKYKESQNRIVTMALIHEKLYQNKDLSHVDFADYTRDLCENLMVSYGIDRDRVRLKIDSQKTDIPVDTAIPCGFIINELITNALKHAFPEGRSGTISLSFKRTPGDIYDLTISDDGVGFPRNLGIYDTNTLGMQLVTVLVKQLGGTIKLERKRGTVVSIRLREYYEAGTTLY